MMGERCYAGCLPAVSCDHDLRKAYVSGFSGSASRFGIDEESEGKAKGTLSGRTMIPSQVPAYPLRTQPATVTEVWDLSRDVLRQRLLVAQRNSFPRHEATCTIVPANLPPVVARLSGYAEITFGC